jgi:hypothetical protein
LIKEEEEQILLRKRTKEAKEKGNEELKRQIESELQRELDKLKKEERECSDRLITLETQVRNLVEDKMRYDNLSKKKEMDINTYKDFVEKEKKEYEKSIHQLKLKEK